jgi:acetyl-CoA carboxylase carboxyl transferase subunit beta
VSFQTIYSVTMSWLTRILPKIASKPADAENKKKSPIPAGLWTKCPKCDQVLYKEELDDSLQVCPKCGTPQNGGPNNPPPAADNGGFLDWKGVHEEIGADVRPVDTLGFVDSKSYPTRLEASQGATKETDALVVMRGELRRRPVVAAAFDFAFMGGSMGSVVGERFALGVERALRENIPFVTFTSTGGARMQEGLLSLMQMAKTNAAVTLLEKARIPYVSVLTDPTMGGVSASFAFMGDVVIAEPQALIGFAGPRVIEQTVREKLPAGFQRSQMLLEKGAIDMIVDRRDMRQVVSELIALLSNKPTPSV